MLLSGYFALCVSLGVCFAFGAFPATVATVGSAFVAAVGAGLVLLARQWRLHRQQRAASPDPARINCKATRVAERAPLLGDSYTGNLYNSGTQGFAPTHPAGKGEVTLSKSTVDAYLNACGEINTVLDRVEQSVTRSKPRSAAHGAADSLNDSEVLIDSFVFALQAAKNMFQVTTAMTLAPPGKITGADAPEGVVLSEPGNSRRQKDARPACAACTIVEVGTGEPFDEVSEAVFVAPVNQTDAMTGLRGDTIDLERGAKTPPTSRCIGMHDQVSSPIFQNIIFEDDMRAGEKFYNV